MSNVFEAIPSEVILCILELLWDLPTLGYLIQASPRCSAVFDEHHLQLIRRFISDLPDPLPRVLINLSISQHVFTREIVESYPTVEQFVGSYIRTYERERPQASAVKMSLSAARQIIDTACSIRSCAQAFFETFLGRMNTLKPSHIADPGLHTRARIPKYDTIVGERYRIAQLWCPSWIEEQKVIRILWQIHIYFIIKSFLASQTGYEGQNWVFLLDEKPSRIWTTSTNDHRYVQQSELDCVYDFLAETHMGTETLECLPTVTSKRTLASQPRPSNDEISEVWQRNESYVYGAAPALPFFITSGLHYPGSYLSGLSFEPFQRLGFSIWGLEKMVQWELIRAPRRLEDGTYGQYRVMGMPDILYTWRSIYGDSGVKWKSGYWTPHGGEES